MKDLILITIFAGTALFTACKKEPPPPPPPPQSQSADPHGGMDMANPHAGQAMGEKPGDPHAGMDMNKGMGGMFGAPTPDIKADIAADGSLKVGSLRGKFPSGWKSVPPPSQMRLAQVELPPASGDPEGGELAIFYLGTDAGGVQPNIDRWCAQFGQPDGKQTKDVAKTEEVTVGDLKVTIVKFTGTMHATSMPGMPQKGPREKWMNLSCIVMTPEGPYFFKGTGPEKTMQAQEGKMKEFVKTLQFGPAS